MLFYIMHKRKSYLKEVCTKNIYFKFFKNKLAKLISSDMEKNWPKSFSDTSSNSLDIEGEITKQINMLKPFDTEPHKAIPKKYFVLARGYNCEEEINLTQQDRIGNIN